MKVTKGSITIPTEGNTLTTLEYHDVPVKEVAHALIELAQPKLEISVTDQQVQKFQDEAKREYINTKLFNDFEAYVELYTRLKIDAYIRLEHAKQAFNDAVMAYSKQIQELKSK